MKNLVFTLILSFLAISTYGQDITGQWNGILKVQGIQLRIVFHINKTGATYTSTMDSPDQKANGIPVTSTSFENQILKLAMASAGIEYEGKLDGSGTVGGDFRQGGQSFPMILSREVAEKKARPQDPVKPYPYYAEDVFFKNKKDGVILAGTLTLPKKDGSNFPVVVLISGSGAQNRDEELADHRPFLVWSDYLTKNGIAVLRYDDRGTAQSKGDFSTATSETLAGDVTAAVQYLLTRKEIDKKNIGLVGHSEGGILAPMVASTSKDVNFIVLLAGTGIPGSELLLRQSELIGRASGISEKDLEERKKANKVAFDMVATAMDTARLRTDLDQYIKKVMAENPAALKAAGMSDDDFVKVQLKQLLSPWMIYFIKHDPAPILSKVRCSVLALNGAKDLQVPAEVNLSAIRGALEKGGNKKVTIKELPDLNHLFQECTTGSPSEYAVIEQTISPTALDEVTKWILSR